MRDPQETPGLMRLGTIRHLTIAPDTGPAPGFVLKDAVHRAAVKRHPQRAGTVAAACRLRKTAVAIFCGIRALGSSPLSLAAFETIL